VVDLRKASKTRGRVFTRELTEENREMLFIPEGFAHGFLSLADKATMIYLANQMHSPEHDTGIAWNSIGFNWPVTDPILSARDLSFQPLPEFASPF